MLRASSGRAPNAITVASSRGRAWTRAAHTACTSAGRGRRGGTLLAVGTAILPLLSRLVAADDNAGAVGALNRAIELTLFLSLPAMLAFLAVADEIIAALFQRGHFGPAASQATAFALTAYAVGLPAYVLVKVLGPAYFARRDTRTPVIIGALSMVVNVVLNLILMQFLAHAGLALATALSAWLNVGLLAWILHRRGHLQVDDRLRRRLGRILPAALIMGAVLWWLAAALSAWFAGGEAWRAAALAVLVAGGLAVFAAAALGLGAVRLEELRGLLSRRD